MDIFKSEDTVSIFFTNLKFKIIESNWFEKKECRGELKIYISLCQSLSYEGPKYVFFADLLQSFAESVHWWYKGCVVFDLKKRYKII
ncbi:hypothetical protein BpHYR1_010362 [Brachionus plicatilis]|uniref:Uncharacterized protein n=1 Tax=Brachionus plicatilis TaxID=10195 RepID=A0A3M7P657_BRAPC|nr:hypothetical protein BpHYR1_010362 [Brachionus plicatilis]